MCNDLFFRREFFFGVTYKLWFSTSFGSMTLGNASSEGQSILYIVRPLIVWENTGGGISKLSFNNELSVGNGKG